MTMIINLTQHLATQEQASSGVIEPEEKSAVRSALTFGSLPTADEIEARAKALAEIAADSGATAAMIGGAPYLMSALERALTQRGITPVYAFSVRESVETTAPDGAVVKTNVFRHVGFVAP